MSLSSISDLMSSISKTNAKADLGSLGKYGINVPSSWNNGWADQYKAKQQYEMAPNSYANPSEAYQVPTQYPQQNQSFSNNSPFEEQGEDRERSGVSEYQKALGDLRGKYDNSEGPQKLQYSADSFPADEESSAGLLGAPMLGIPTGVFGTGLSDLIDREYRLANPYWFVGSSPSRESGESDEDYTKRYMEWYNGVPEEVKSAGRTRGEYLEEQAKKAEEEKQQAAQQREADARKEYDLEHMADIAYATGNPELGDWITAGGPGYRDESIDDVRYGEFMTQYNNMRNAIESGDLNRAVGGVKYNDWSLYDPGAIESNSSTTGSGRSRDYDFVPGLSQADEYYRMKESELGNEFKDMFGDISYAEALAEADPEVWMWLMTNMPGWYDIRYESDSPEAARDKFLSNRVSWQDYLDNTDIPLDTYMEMLMYLYDSGMLEDEGIYSSYSNPEAFAAAGVLDRLASDGYGLSDTVIGDANDIFQRGGYGFTLGHAGDGSSYIPLEQLLANGYELDKGTADLLAKVESNYNAQNGSRGQTLGFK